MWDTAAHLLEHDWGLSMIGFVPPKVPPGRDIVSLILLEEFGFVSPNARPDRAEIAPGRVAGARWRGAAAGLMIRDGECALGRSWRDMHFSVLANGLPM